MSSHGAGKAASAKSSDGNIGLLAAISIGVGAMIGAGVFSILGVIAGISGSAMWLSFLIGGFVALFIAYSYVKMGKTFPSVGGAVTFMVRGYGDNVSAGTLNLFQYFAFVISIAIYASGFASYAQTFVDLPAKAYAVGVILLFTFVNFLGSRIMGKAESVIVVTKVTILIIFIGFALAAIDGNTAPRLDPSGWPTVLKILTGAGVVFVGYEGFGLITNAAANMKKPKWELPRAIYGSMAIVIVIYVLVALGVVASEPLTTLKSLGNDALAVAAKPSMGQIGYTLVCIAAVLSTASAVNATLFGCANVSYQISKNGGLPGEFTRQLWGKDVEGLFITSAIGIIFVLIFPLSAVASMGSAGFLIVYVAINFGHLKIRKQTGGNPILLWIGIILCAVLFVILFKYMIEDSPSSAIAMVVTFALSFVIEVVYRKRTGRNFGKLLSETDPKPDAQGATAPAPAPAGS